ncbi:MULTISPECIES: response regulator [unclassified Halomonas]|uniref:response regulator n=1 Tax=unclassified Halomonas TaxID=2609666 RepID=UPI0021E4B724|nr:MULTISPECIES: response regulator [unclassified Halomonas]UYF99725.1 response regulator [Halomonas sp. GD1P12]WNL39181.1 response regulator [Halomonas sp. PAMB 3232]WNL42524.1 response regulator [Halomonas sp. PAMB 3264]
MSEPFVVLLVEDEPADVHLSRMAFREGQMLVEVFDVGDGVEALAFLQREGRYADAPKPDLILLDLNMPRMDGKTFLKRIKTIEALRRIPVVVLTTSEAEADIFASYDLGAAGFIVKPMDIERFIASIRSLEEYWLTLVRRPA